MSVDHGLGAAGPVETRLWEMAGSRDPMVITITGKQALMLAREIDKINLKLDNPLIPYDLRNPPKSAPTENGGLRTGNDTTPTCGSTVEGKGWKNLPKVGEPCPHCGQRTRPMTNAERQRRWRERQKES